MHRHRLARFAAILIFLAALVYCVLALAAGVWAFRGGPAGWGPGWRGWVLIPVLASGCFGAVGLLIFGAVVYFLTRIERNLASAARQREAAAAKPVAAPSVAAPVIAAGAAVTVAAEEQLAEAAPLIAPVEAAVELPEPLVEAVVQAPEIVPPAVVAELPQLTVEATPAEVEVEPLADVSATLPELAVEVGPVVEVVAPAISAPTPEVYFPSVEIFEPELEAGAPTSEATLPEIELPTVEVAEPKVEATLPEVRRVPAIEIAEPQVEAPLAVMRRAPAIEIAEPQVEAPLAVMRRAPAIEIAAPDEMTALRAQLAALQARLADLEAQPAATVNVHVVPVKLPVAPEVENLPAAAVGRLPGAVEAARIAAEMAALKPAPRHEPAAPTLMAASGPLAAEVKPPSAGAPADDLLVIQGIGPTYARRLAEVGITTFAALAAASDELLDQITIGLPGRAIREDWRGQARQLAG